VAAARYAPAAQMPAPVSTGLIDVTVNGEDVPNVEVRVQPSVTVTGKVVLKSRMAGAAVDYSRFTVRLSPSSTTSPVVVGSPNAVIAADGMFQIDGVVPGSYRLTASSAIIGAGAWSLQSAILGDKDVVDVPFEVALPLAGLMVTFTDSPTELAGLLTDVAGQPAPQLYVFVFPQNQSLWLPNSRRVVSTRSAESGSYRIAGLPPGDYYVCALSELDTALQTEPSYLEQFVPSSIKITLGEGEKKVQSLRIGG
jgi:hypothetical protein